MRVKKTVLYIMALFILPFPFNFITQGSQSSPIPVAEPLVSTYAGMGTRGSKDGEFALFNLPQGLTGKDGTLWIADTYNNMIRTVKDGAAATIAGSILALDDYRFPKGYYRDGLLANVLLNRPSGMVFDEHGRLYITDSGNHAVRVIDGGKLVTYGGGTAGYRNGRIESARFNHPSAIAADSLGNLYIADTLNHCIRKIDSWGNVTTAAGQPRTAGFADGPATGKQSPALFNNPMGIAVSKNGLVIYVADTGNHRIRVIANGYVSSVGYTSDKDEDGSPLGGFADGRSHEAMFNLPAGLALVNDEILIIADSANHRIRALTMDGRVKTLAGNGEPGAANGLAMEALFNFPKGVYVEDGIIYIADTGNNLIRQMPLEMDFFK